MSAPSEMPDDENGAVLRRMRDGGDSLTQPRNVDFCFAFSERRQALAFTEVVDDRELEVCISYYEERDMWQTIVTRFMVPTHAEITATEFTLTQQAESVGGEADGWGCMRITNESKA
jgi:Regulator of ribonuclease activity B